ncbi:hypothetical protein BGCPKDLD_2209 [Methylorubrum suomiense]|uniref:Uncharacterized protein n=1 Tax=Methylorubrum suomiense TaxID=144191 RepID=A0ABQ4UW46_9HYPH|nr:hypothetical protein BGCPKDLD_2209 [Methylorubrum suomiense]
MGAVSRSLQPLEVRRDRAGSALSGRKSCLTDAVAAGPKGTRKGLRKPLAG